MEILARPDPIEQAFGRYDLVHPKPKPWRKIKRKKNTPPPSRGGEVNN